MLKHGARKNAHHSTWSNLQRDVRGESYIEDERFQIEEIKIYTEAAQKPPHKLNHTTHLTQIFKILQQTSLAYNTNLSQKCYFYSQHFECT